MIKKFTYTLFALLFVVVGKSNPVDTIYQHWKFDNLNLIGSVVPQIQGEPSVFEINKSVAAYFDGIDDKITMPVNPLSGLEEFTFEVVFRVDEGGVSEQKFLHMQANPDIRILFELEFVNDSMWYMENYIQTGTGDNQKIHLQDLTKLYPANHWYHAAIVYKNGEFKQFINYTNDNTETLEWTSPVDGSVSIGARMNNVNYMKGAVRDIRFANKALSPDDFMYYGTLMEASDTFLLNNLEKINGYDLEVYGDPQVVETHLGKGIEFDGNQDGIYILTNPLGESTTFTIETIILPYDAYPSNTDPRYLHFEDPSDGNRRITMELRLNDQHQWYFDGFIKSPNNNLTLIDESKVHDIGDSLQHIAITYNNGEFKTYVNYKNELTGSVTYLPISSNGKMSLGMRMNKVNYFNGVIYAVRVTKALLTPEQFMEVYPESTEPTSNALVQSSIDQPYKLILNPEDKTATIRFNQLNEADLYMRVYNIRGENIKSKNFPHLKEGMQELGFSIEGLSSGLYLLSLEQNQQLHSLKVIIP